MVYATARYVKGRERCKGNGEKRERKKEPAQHRNGKRIGRKAMGKK